MTSALVVVDVQHDFLTGSLGGEGRDRVLDPLVRAAGAVDYVVASMDWHPADHCSFASEPTFTDGSWPAHCVEGTFGATLAEPISALNPTVMFKGTLPDREAYSAFDAADQYGRTLVADLSMHGVDQVFVGGLCTDYCVKATVLDALKHEFKTTLLLDACAGVDPRTTDAALDAMVEAGADVALASSMKVGMKGGV